MTTADRPGPWTVLRWSAWVGLVAGTLELLAFLAKCHLFDPRNYNASRHFVWMYPAAGVLVVGVPGVFLAAFAAVKRLRLPAAAVVGVLSFVGYAGVLFRAPLFTAACLLGAAGLAAQTGRWAARRTAAFDTVVRRSLVPVTAAVAVGSWGFLATVGGTGGVSSAPAARGRNVVLLVLDTVRAESLSLYGYPRDTTPNLRRLAERGVRFDRAFATAPWTAPSHAGMFTGRTPHELSVGWDRPLDGEHPTLAGFLASRGYATAGFVANTTYCSYETGLARGFGHYEDYDVTPRAVLLCSAAVQRALVVAERRPALGRLLDRLTGASSHRKSAARVNADFLAWVDRHRDRPFFAFLNVYDAHHPYVPPEPGAGDGRDDPLLRDWWRADKRSLTPAEVARARDAYERCIASLDRQVGALFDALDRRGILKDTLVIVTADHGEHLGERGIYGHGVSLYRPELHVPLLVIDPGQSPAGAVVREPVSLADLPATVVDRLRLSGSPFPGQSLAAAWSGQANGRLVRSDVLAPPEDDPNHGASPARRGPLTSLVGWGHHYIRDAAGNEELYDLEADAGESEDLARRPASAGVMARFRESLDGRRVASRR